MTASAIRVLDDSAGTVLTDSRDSYFQGLTYNATQDRFYFCRPSSTTGIVWQYVESDLSASGTVGSAMTSGGSHAYSAASDDGDYLVCAYLNSTTGYYLGRLTLSSESASNTIQSWSPSFNTQGIRIGCTGTDSFVILYHGPNEKVHGTNYERLYYRTYVPSTDTLGSETIVSGSHSQSGVQDDFVIFTTPNAVYMRGNYTQDRAQFLMGRVGTGTQGGYYDASAGTWTAWSLGGYAPGMVHNYNGGTEEFYRPKSGNVGRYDGWGDSTETDESVTNAAGDKDNLLHVDHANDEVFLTQVSTTSNVRRKKRNTSGTWDTSWTDDTITLTGATSIRTNISNDARYFSTQNGILVRTAVTNQTSGRGLHLIKISLSNAQTVNVGAASETETAVAAAVLQEQVIAVGAASETESGGVQTGYVLLDATAEFISTPDHVDFDVPTNGILDVRVDLALDDYENAGGGAMSIGPNKWAGDTTNDSWYFGWNQVDQRMRLSWRNDAQTQTTDTGQPQTGVFTDGSRYQWRCRFDTSGGTNNLEWFYRSDGNIESDTGWTSAGTRTYAATTIQDTGSTATIGTEYGTLVAVLGKIYRAIVKIDGGLVSSPDFTATDFPHTDQQGRVWSLQSSATAVRPAVLAKKSISIAVGASSETETAQTVAVVTPGQTIAVGAASETETAVAVAAELAQSIAVGPASETETAQPVTANTTISIAVAAASETETAQTVTADTSISVAVGAAAETETAVAVAAVPGVASIAVGAASEVETGQPVTTDTTVTVAVGASAETETAQPIQIDRSVNVGAASETETGVAVAAELTGAPQSITVTAASETETAVAITADTTISISVGAASETETGQAITADTAISVAVGAASETETAQPVAVVTAVTIAVGAASETETAVAVPVILSQTVAVGPAAETETAQAIQIDRTVNVGAAAETETAQIVVVNIDQSIAVGAASETETAVAAPAVLGTVVNVLAASETESAVAVQIDVTVPVTAAAETETGVSIPALPSISVSVAAASETETAVAVAADKSISVAVGPASETETAVGVTADATISVTVGAASETETAVAVAVVQGGATQTIPVVAASETESAVAVTADASITVTVTPASETETAVGVGVATAVSVSVTPASETETAVAVQVLQEQIISVGAASETESAVAVAVIQAGAPQSITVNPASETETAVAVDIDQDQSISVGTASETETAQPVSVDTSYTVAVGAASETETAVAVSAVAGNVNVTVDPASETETGVAVGSGGATSVTVNPASETEIAQGVTVDTSYSVSIAAAQELETAVAVPGIFPSIIAVGPASEVESGVAVGALGQVPDVVVTNVILNDSGARSVVMSDSGARSVDVRYYSGA